MNINTLQLEKTDKIMIFHNIENVPPSDVDEYMNKVTDHMTYVFGTVKVITIPVRGGKPWDFTVVRQPKNKIS
jgi:hypothetical protein